VELTGGLAAGPALREEEAMPKPICFMIMPYGRKPTQAEAGRGVPEIDFNALWDRAFAPTILSLGCEPVRADQDTGALIITQMIERLYSPTSCSPT
jgi:hypothetical protein